MAKQSWPPLQKECLQKSKISFIMKWCGMSLPLFALVCCLHPGLPLDCCEQFGGCRQYILFPCKTLPQEKLLTVKVYHILGKLQEKFSMWLQKREKKETKTMKKQHSGAAFYVQFMDAAANRWAARHECHCSFPASADPEWARFFHSYLWYAPEDEAHVQRSPGRSCPL